jgi:hypothetical protein
MEKTRQHTALDPSLLPYWIISVCSYLAIVTGIVGQFLFGGLWLLWCGVAFLWLCFTGECVRYRTLFSRRTEHLILPAFYFVLAVGATYAVASLSGSQVG